jgi:hypothetical protein
MAEGRQREAWNHTAALLALLANCHRDPRRSRPFTVTDFHPLTEPPPPPPRADITILKAIFIDGHLPEIPCNASSRSSFPSP